MDVKQLKEKTDFARSVIGLARDMWIMLILLLSVLIIYFGGEPEKLNLLDWAKLSLWAMAIVIVPFLVYLALQPFRLAVRAANEVANYLLGKSTRVPRSGIFVMSPFQRVHTLSTKRQYIRILKEGRGNLTKRQILAVSWGRWFAWYVLETLMQPIVGAGIIALWMFLEALKDYAPNVPI